MFSKIEIHDLKDRDEKTTEECQEQKLHITIGEKNSERLWRLR
jgi:hypothetical protein